MSLFSRLFGGKTAEIEPENYKDFLIYPEPVHEGGKWRISGRIEKDIAGETKSHHLIRADTLDSQDDAIAATISKARQVIDEQGEHIFRGS